MIRKSVVLQIPVNKISDEVFALRLHHDEERLQELADSFRQKGLLQPIIVRAIKPKGAYQLVVGSRRLRAAKLAGATHIPSLLYDHLENRDAIVIALSENIQREQLTFFEEARAYSLLVNDYKMDMVAIARATGKTESVVRKRIQLLSLPEELQEMVADKKLGLAQATQLVVLKDPQKQITLGQYASTNQLNERELAIRIAQEIEQQTAPTKWRGAVPQVPSVRGNSLTNAPSVVGLPQRSLNHPVKRVVAVTAEKFQLQCKAFEKTVETNLPLIATMKGADIHNSKLQLQKLVDLLQRGVELLEGKRLSL